MTLLSGRGYAIRGFHIVDAAVLFLVEPHLADPGGHVETFEAHRPDFAFPACIVGHPFEPQNFLGELYGFFRLLLILGERVDAAPDVSADVGARDQDIAACCSIFADGLSDMCREDGMGDSSSYDAQKGADLLAADDVHHRVIPCRGDVEGVG